MSLEVSGVLVECAGELREEISDVVAEGAGSLHGAQRVGVRRDAAESGGAFCDGFAMLLKMTRELVRLSNSKNRSGGSHLFLKNRAGLGEVGVKGFDDVGVLLFDNAALDLKGEGEAAVVEGEILGENSKALDGFVLREMDGETLDLGGD